MDEELKEILSMIEDDIISTAAEMGYGSEDKMDEMDAFIDGSNYVIDEIKKWIKSKNK